MKFERIINNMPGTNIKDSDVHGKGLFASKEFIRNDVIGKLDGQLIPWKVYDEYTKNTNNSGAYNHYEIYDEWNAIDDNLVLLRLFRTKYSFINHSRKPNAEIKFNPLRVEVIAEVIHDGDEILIDYRRENLREEYLHGKGRHYL